MIPASRQNYLHEIADCISEYHKFADTQSELCFDIQALNRAQELGGTDAKAKVSELQEQLDPHLKGELDEWQSRVDNYNSNEFSYQVRKRDIKVEPRFKTLSHLNLPRVALPKYKSNYELSQFLQKENVPGRFPFTAGVFPFRRKGEDPKRQFAGEGGPIRTNNRFHYLTKNDKFKRLSTAFASVTLYGY